MWGGETGAQVVSFLSPFPSPANISLTAGVISHPLFISMASLVALLAPLVSASTEADAPSVTWLTHVINNSCVMLVFYAIDHLLLKPWIKTQTKPKDVTIARCGGRVVCFPHLRAAHLMLR